MPGERLSMRKIRELLRLRWEQHLSQRVTANSLRLSQASVSDYIIRARRAGLTWPLPDGLDDAGLEALLFPPRPDIPSDQRPVPDWSAVHRDLRRPNVTLALLWEEYRAATTDGFGYSWFCDLYREWAGRLKPTLRQVHIAGERLFVDFAGHTMEMIDAATGEIHRAEIFVAVLGASSFIYAEATASQALADWIGAHVNALNAIGGVPRQIVSDNLKAGITKACFYEPTVNRTYADMAAHYRTAIIPARPYKPRDKAKVEVGVQVVQRWILARLRNRRFFSLAELNRAIRELVDQLNDRTMRGWGTTRRALFEQLDRPALQSLPPTPYEYADWKHCRVHLDYHIEIAKLSTRCRSGCCARKWRRGSPPKPWRSSTVASWSPRICATCDRIGPPLWTSTCRVRTGVTATGRMSGSSAKRPQSATTPRRWSRSCCVHARTPNRGSAPASASSACANATAPNGWTPPAPRRWRSAPAHTVQSLRS
jgi:transposase